MTRGWRIGLAIWVAVLVAVAAGLPMVLNRIVVDHDLFPQGTIITGWLTVGGSLLLVLATPAFALAQRDALRRAGLTGRDAAVTAWLSACRLVGWFVLGLAVVGVAAVPFGGVSPGRLVIGPLAAFVVLAVVLAIQVGLVASLRSKGLATAATIVTAVALLVVPIVGATIVELATTHRGTGLEGWETSVDTFPSWYIVAADPLVVVADATPWVLIDDPARSAEPLGNGLDPQAVVSGRAREWRVADTQREKWVFSGWTLEGASQAPIVWPYGLLVLGTLGAISLGIGARRVSANRPTTAPMEPARV